MYLKACSCYVQHTELPLTLMGIQCLSVKDTHMCGFEFCVLFLYSLRVR